MARIKTKKQRTRLFKIKLIIGIVVLIILIVSSFFIAHYDRLLISSIVVTGNKTVTDTEIRQVVDRELAGNYLWFYPKRNSFLFPRERVLASLVASLPQLSNIKLEQKNLQTLELLVKERQGEFLWCSNRQCYFADKTGFVFAPAPKFSGLVFFEFWSDKISSPIGRRPLPTADWQKLIAGQEQLSVVLNKAAFSGQKISRTTSAELRDWYFQVTDESGEKKSWEIKLDLDQDLELAVRTFRAALRDPSFLQDLEAYDWELEYIDLRFAPKVFYRYNNQ